MGKPQINGRNRFIGGLFVDNNLRLRYRAEARRLDVTLDYVILPQQYQAGVAVTTVESRLILPLVVSSSVAQKGSKTCGFN